MPAETHQRGAEVDEDVLVGFLATVIGVDVGHEHALADLDLDDDLAVLDLWEAVAEEFGERAVAELDLPDRRPATVGELVELFVGGLRAARPRAGDSSPDV